MATSMPTMSRFAAVLASAALLGACGGGGVGAEAPILASTPQDVACASHADRRAAILAADATIQINDVDILRFGFVDPVATDWLLHDPINTVAGVRSSNNAVFMLAEGFETSFDCITVQSATELVDRTGTQHAVRVAYSYRGTGYSALAYGRLPTSSGSDTAAGDRKSTR